MIQRQTTLSANMVTFCRFLRQEGFKISIQEAQDALTAIEILQPYDEPESFQLCLQAALCRTPLEIQQFPELYRRFWRELDKAVDSKIKDEPEKKPQPSAQQKQAHFEALKQWLHGNRQEDTANTAAYSDLESSGGYDMAMFSEKELALVMDWVKKLVEKIANRRSRRFQRTHQRRQVDLRRSIRKNILAYGEIINIKYKKKKKTRLDVVLLCDVSRSMELYSRFFIQFMYGFQRLFPRVHCYIFSTRLAPISKELTNVRTLQSLQRIADKLNALSGGTRIGESIQIFNQRYASQVLHSKTLVFILSDGWDTGAPRLMSEQMQQLQQRAMQVIWLNPLAGNPSWTPEAVGMQAALPYIDLLLPFHNVESIREVVERL